VGIAVAEALGVAVAVPVSVGRGVAVPVAVGTRGAVLLSLSSQARANSPVAKVSARNNFVRIDFMS